MFQRRHGREVEEGLRHGGRGCESRERHFRGGRSEREFGGQGFGAPVTGGPGFGAPGYGGRERGGRSRGRVFETGDLRFVILKLIAERPSYGYEIIKQIEERLGGMYAPSPGVVYPTLTLLEELGYVTVTVGEGTKKLHTITDEGKAALATNKAAVDALFERIEQAGAAYGRGRSPQIMRAVANLHMALRMKTSQGNLNEEQVRKIVQTIDAAVKQIEEG